MKNQVGIKDIRVYKYTKKATLKDGTIREYEYKIKQEAKEGRVICGKGEIIRRFRLCWDKEKVERIRALFDELGL